MLCLCYTWFGLLLDYIGHFLELALTNNNNKKKNNILLTLIWEIATENPPLDYRASYTQSSSHPKYHNNKTQHKHATKLVNVVCVRAMSHRIFYLLY